MGESVVSTAMRVGGLQRFGQYRNPCRRLTEFRIVRLVHRNLRRRLAEDCRLLESPL